jgi:hypothetical protein
MAIFGEVASAACTIPDFGAGDVPRRSLGSGQWAFLGIMQRQPVKPRPFESGAESFAARRGVGLIAVSIPGRVPQLPQVVRNR